MIIKLTTSQFTEDNGYYYSPGFMQDIKDTMVTVAVWLSEPGEITIEASIDQVEWVEIGGSSFTCNNIVMQTYVDCHHGLAYRVKSDKAPEKAWILA